MRIAVAVVVGVVLCGAGHMARADQPPRQRSETCLDSCNFVFQKCQVHQGPKGAVSCSRNVVQCKKECPYEAVEGTAIPTEKSHSRCVDACRGVFKACQGRVESRRGGSCAADDMRCEKACPKPEPDLAAAPPPAPPAVPGRESVAAPVAPAPKVKSQPRRAARVEGAAAPAPASATPAATVGERAGATAPTVRSEAVTPPAAAPTEASTAAVRPAQNERGFFGKIVCFFRSCEPAGSLPCLEQCGTVYDQCHAHESKRGGECNTRLMHCRQECRDAPPAAAP